MTTVLTFIVEDNPTIRRNLAGTLAPIRSSAFVS